MFLEQICPGQVNSHPQAIHTFVYKNDRFIVSFYEKKKNDFRLTFVVYIDRFMRQVQK